jgi:multiple sugar transport system substrate-binding protein
MKWRLGIFVLSIVFVFSAVQAEDAPVIKALKCEKPGKLTMWVWDTNWQKTIQASIDRWIKGYCPGAEVDLQQQPWNQYWNVLAAHVTDRVLPDVFNMSQDRFYFYASNGALLDLQPYWDGAGVDTSVWGTGEVDPYRWGDKDDLYAGPVNWDTVAVYYNKDVFDAAGLKYPTADWTWDDFAAYAEKLTNPDKGVYGAAVYAEYQAGYANWIASTGTVPVVGAARTQCTLNTDASVKALNFLKDLYDKGYMPSVTMMGGPSADDEFNFFAAGKVAMITGGSWKLPDAFGKLGFNWDVVQLPKNPDSGRSRSILHSVGYVASARTANPDLAANLILYLVSDEGQKFFAEAGGVAPANPSPEIQTQWIKSFGSSDKNIQAFVDATKDSQGVTPFAEIWDKMNTEMVVNIFDLNKTVEDATQDACDFINQQLPNAKK